MVGYIFFPLTSQAWIPDDLRKLHDESIEQKEVRREQFRQDIFERRKDVLMKWADRKQELEETLSREREKIKSEFELRRPRKKAGASSTPVTETQEQGMPIENSFFSAIRKSVQNITHFFLPLKDLFENTER